VVGITLADKVRRNQFGVRIQRNERPDIAVGTSAGSVLLLGTNESLNFINFDIFAVQAAHFLIHDFLASVADTTV